MTTLYNNFKQLLLNGGVDLDSDVIKFALISDSISYSPDIDGDVYVDDVLNGVDAAELSATNYSRKTASVTVSLDLATDEAVMDASDPVWASLGGASNDTISGVLLFKEVTTDADSPVIGHFTSADFPLPTNGGDVTIAVDTAGLFTLG